MGVSRSVVDNQKQAVYNIDAVSGCRTVSDGYLVFALGKVCINHYGSAAPAFTQIRLL